MRLKCIKLVGFKSFVDMTTVTFPDNMCGVVGPNGCGKSNIIDAVRWVMGESSAKNLRGESMTDVIFKGSKARKASGYAQVELVFDNQEKRITGEYAAYSEISVKRRLTSDAQNTYFLNGVKCRRRDIMDIFLGTGLGPRSYSIISQGMISNLIESRPEELRVFIEEAAGISKYKERRRETENRIRRTTENLERLGDLREELDKRLTHLKKQAEAAEKYKSLKEEERQKRAELHALRWKGMHDNMNVQQGLIREHELEVEAIVTRQVSSESKIEKLRIERQSCDDTFQNAQSLYYGTGNDITRLEQMITHRKEKEEQLARDLSESESLEQEISSQIMVDQEAITEIDQEMEILLPEEEVVMTSTESSRKKLAEVEEKMTAWLGAWDEFRAETENVRRKAEVSQSGIQHVEQVLGRLDDQIRRHKEELDVLEESQDVEVLESLRERQIEREEECERFGQALERITKETLELREEIETLDQRRQACYQKINEAKGTRASLEALRQAALGHGEASQKWLESRGLDKAKRLVDTLRVMEGWDVAVETVLGDFIQSVTIDDIENFARTIGDKDEINLNAVSLSLKPLVRVASETVLNEAGVARLVDYIQDASELSLFQNIFAVDTITQAIDILPCLSSHESVITKSGVWLGAGWIRVVREDDEASGGILARQQALEETENRLHSLESELKTILPALDEAKKKLLDHERLQQENIEKQTQVSRYLGEIKAELSAMQVRMEEESRQRARLRENSIELKEQYAVEQEKLAEYRESLQEALDIMEKDSQREAALESEKMELKNAIDTGRLEFKTCQEKSHAIALKKQGLKTRHQAKIQAMERLEDQMERLKARVQSLKASISETRESSDDMLRQELETLLEKQSCEHEVMIEARSSLDAVNEKLKLIESEKSVAENELQRIRSHLESLRMDEQAMRIRCTTLEEQLVDERFDLETLVSSLPEGVDENGWEQVLSRLELKISQLGAINLAAIEEYDQQSERLRYLNIQNDDLEDALKTLGHAIDKIDTETRNRFESTFNKVNNGLRDIFPRVFGGGQACLEQTGDDFLNTGVTIMAQPPGKKNSTIHLLSGGEKALTAIALVFAIFRLNPSPFCLLDEVDAPLDDANVGRYAKMVKEMSAQVQFIYVTHNKIAMEAASQLIGVTMHEPGVSRPVSVDIDSAAEMATA